MLRRLLKGTAFVLTLGLILYLPLLNSCLSISIEKNMELENIEADPLFDPPEPETESTMETIEIQEKEEKANRSSEVIQSFIEQYSNDDIIGYIKIDGTHIDYPVVYCYDNDFYLKRSYDKKSSVSGSIFMDYENDIHEDNKNIVIYGHNMKNKTMFGDLVNYKNYDYFLTHRYIQFDTLEQEGTWEIFSAHIWPDANNPFYIQVYFSDEESFGTFVHAVKSFSMYDTGVSADKNDKILTLSTCSYETGNARFVVHAKLLAN